MKKLDTAFLNEEIEELAEKGIHKGYRCVIDETDGDVWEVCFFNAMDKGKYAFAKVNKKYLTFLIETPDSIAEEMTNFLASVDRKKYCRFEECDVKEYDKVALAVEKYEYAREGVHKGDEGCVFGEYAIDGEWWICFTIKENGKFRDVELNVKREDFIIVE